jgi:uncharacterized repeat protein (TIGR03803 family)
VTRPRYFMLVAALATFLPRTAAAQTPAYETLYSFKGGNDGLNPQGGLVISSDGALYGTTYAGGSYRYGTVFELTRPPGAAPWKKTVLHHFSGPPDGQYPASTLTLGSTGDLYGATVGGGGGGGVIFQVAPPAHAGGFWTEAVLYSFTLSNIQNVIPNGPILISPGGALYTTTEGASAGFANFGLVIALAPPSTSGGDWTEYEPYSFHGNPDGEGPRAGLVFQGGSFFGTTYGGGDEFCDCGTVYEVTPTPAGAWTETIIHTFGETPGDGENPLAALTLGPGGVLYGTTEFGGSGVCATSEGAYPGCGTVFQLTPPTAPGGTWTESILYTFATTNGDGAAPVAGVVAGKNGALYGTTEWGGSATSDSACPASYYVVAGCGIVFEMMPPAAPGGAWTERILHSFSGQDGDGAIPVAGLALSTTGVLYGATSAGGAAGAGTIFAVAP